MSTALQPKTASISAEGGALVAKAGGKDKTVEETYKKVSQREHVLLRPDAYIGSAVRARQPPIHCWDEASQRMVMRELTFAPGMFKIFDEILVNAADHKQRCASMKNLRVEIEPENCRISVWNDGSGIPVEMHEQEGVYVPELIFGHLLTSSNYDDAEKKVVGGRNGFGAKLANIFSTQFIVETADSKTGLKYKQVFRNHMEVIGKPHIVKATKKNDNWTCISFFPDLALFGMDSLDDDLVALLTKRVYDIAGTNPSVKVSLNGARLPIKSFKDYIALYHEPDPEVPFVHQRCGERWEIAIGASHEAALEQVSFVNSIWTSKGGAHVSHIVDQIVAKIQEHVLKKDKSMKLKPHQIKAHLSVFVNALIENPAFDSQTKETLTTKPSQFGSKCVISDDVFKKVLKSGVVENVLTYAKVKQNKELSKSDGGKKIRVLGIKKLDDANKAGGRDSNKCTLILTEGDSAKALAISGLSVIGRDYYGVFPLRGKLLNVREASHKQIKDNAEITNLKKILGLQQGKTYSSDNIKSLRYGHVLIMTDQDSDGSHIKGLLINFFDHFWPGLLQVDGFLQEFITPIVKCVKGKSQKVFFTIPEYRQWIETASVGWRPKYYKGLGTSTSAEAKSYFGNLPQHLHDFTWGGDDDGKMIELAFAKAKVKDRKEWLTGYVPGTYFNHTVDVLNFSNFINKELILFSIADNARSIPNVIDGLKPSQRKVLFSCFKRKLSKTEIKVSQLSGYVSEQSAYHHGEASLQATILGLAQNFVGSNNANLLVPAGQFGTRLQGGKDAASSRYIFTKLAPIARALFPDSDDPLLKYLEDDGMSIEPEWYCPIIPLVLLNGADGIGTGWSSQVPCYNPRDLISNIRRMINGQLPEVLIPWYRGFNGSIVPVGNSQSYDVYGSVFQGETPNVFRIRELPVRSWTTPFKDFLEDHTEGNGEAGKDEFIKEFTDHSTENKVSFDLTLTPTAVSGMKADDVHKKLKLSGSLTTSNMMLFDAAGRIHKYEDTTSIFSEFFQVRMDLYSKRRDYIWDALQQELDRLDNKQRFVLMVIDGKLKVAKRKKSDIVAELTQQKFKRIPKKNRTLAGSAREKNLEIEEESESDFSPPSSMPTNQSDFDYLLSLPLWSLTMECVEELCSERDRKEAQKIEMEQTSAADMWKKDLAHLEQVLTEEDDRARKEQTELLLAAKEARRKQVRGGKGRAKVRTSYVDLNEDLDFEDAIVPPSARVERIRQPRKPKVNSVRNKPGNSQSVEVQANASKSKRMVVVLDDCDSDSLDDQGFDSGNESSGLGGESKVNSPASAAATHPCTKDEGDSSSDGGITMTLAERLAQRGRGAANFSGKEPSNVAKQAQSSSQVMSKRPRSSKAAAAPSLPEHVFSPSPNQKKKKSRVFSPVAKQSRTKSSRVPRKAPAPKAPGRAKSVATPNDSEAEEPTEVPKEVVSAGSPGKLVGGRRPRRKVTQKTIVIESDSDDIQDSEDESDFAGDDEDDSDF